MGRVVCEIAVSVDGYVAGPNQTEDKPLGEGPAEELHAWFADEENASVLDQIVAAGAFVMGRNMFEESVRPGRRVSHVTYRFG